jgi:hypothetical protein
MRPLTIRRPRGELARPEPGDEFVSAADFAELIDSAISSDR